MPRTRAHAGLAHVLKDWGFFALAALPGALESLLGLGMVAKELSTTAFGEWVVLLAAITVVGAASQLGMKTAYMQAVVDLAGLARQRQSLRAGIVFLSATGFLAGLLVAVGLGLLAFFGVWDSVAVLGLLPLTMALTNAQMLLVTDLRIRRRLQWLTVMSVVQLPVFAAVLLGLRALGVGGLFLIMASSAVVSGARLAILWWIISPGHPLRARWGFIGPALTLGIPIMLAYLLKYSTDALVNAVVLWGGSSDFVGQWGQIYRLMDPFHALFFTALLLAWTPNAVLIAGPRGAIELARLRRVASLLILLCSGGIGLGLVWHVLATEYFFPDKVVVSVDHLIAFASVSRACSFVCLSFASFGMVGSRNYKPLMKFHLIELVSTVGVCMLVIWNGQYELFLWSIALLPWVVVAWIYLKVSPGLLRLTASRTMVSS